MIDLYERVYVLVRLVPSGRVVTYGDLAAMCGIADPRIVGEAMNASHDVPWQRVINSRGEISIKGATGARQRSLLEQERIVFGADGRVDLSVYSWSPDPAWLDANGYRVPPPPAKGKKGKSGEPSKGNGEQLSLF